MHELNTSFIFIIIIRYECVGILRLAVARRRRDVTRAADVAEAGGSDGVRHKRDTIERRIVHVQRADDTRRAGRHDPPDDARRVGARGFYGPPSQVVARLRRVRARRGGAMSR